MKKVFFAAGLVTVMVLSQGCASVMVASDSRRAIEARQLQGGGAGVGVNLLSARTLTERPGAQFVAAVVDAGLLYGAYYGLSEIAEKAGDSGQKMPTIYQNTGSGNNVIHIGDGSTTTKRDALE